jgi:hypothetical protein
MTSCTPASPRAFKLRRNARPEGGVLAVADPKAEDLAAAIAAHPGGDDHGLGDDAALTRALQ